jgi:hypothetical protein
MRDRRKAGKIAAVGEPPSVNGSRGGQVVFYRSPDGSVKLDVKLEKDTVWLTLNEIAELFGRDKSVIPPFAQYFLLGRVGSRGNRCKICNSST